MPGVRSCGVIPDEVEPVTPEEVDTVISLAAYVLDQPLFWTVKVAKEVTWVWVDTMVSISLGSTAALKEVMVCHLLKRSSLDATLLSTCSPVSNFFLLEKAVQKMVGLQLMVFWDRGWG